MATTNFVKGVGQEVSEQMATHEPGTYEHPASGKRAVVRSVAQADAFTRVGYVRVGDAPSPLANDPILARKEEASLKEENARLQAKIDELEAKKAAEEAVVAAPAESTSSTQAPTETSSTTSTEMEVQVSGTLELNENDYSKKQLVEMATEAGVENADKLPNKAALIEAIAKANNPAS